MLVETGKQSNRKRETINTWVVGLDAGALGGHVGLLAVGADDAAVAGLAVAAVGGGAAAPRRAEAAGLIVKGRGGRRVRACVS